MVVARYDPLVLPHPLNTLFGGDCLKYISRFNGLSETSTEELWNTYYSYVDNQNIENEDAWMCVFVQILDGKLGNGSRDYLLGQ